MPEAEPGPAGDIEDRDPGLARERTDLAWTRTAISFSALGAVMMRTSNCPPRPPHRPTAGGGSTTGASCN